MVKYLEKSIVHAKQTETPRWGMTQEGYTIRSGAPTSWLVLLEGEKRYRRVMILQFSNAGSVFLKIKGERFFFRVDEEIREAAARPAPNTHKGEA